jgi:hypothetical protein
MNIREYAATLPKDKFKEWAESSGTKKVYLKQIVNGHRSPSPELCRNLCEQTGWQVHPAEVLPLFQGIPEYKPGNPKAG